MYIYEGLPVIAKRNKREDENIIWANSEKYYVCGYDDTVITLYTERPNEDGSKEPYIIDVEIQEFRDNFFLCYCCTTHKMQGDTVLEDFTIYDWHMMPTKVRYTALTRAKKMEQISISSLKVPKRPNTFVSNIAKKLKGYKEQDKIKRLKNDIKVADVKSLYEIQNGECKLCNCGMKKTYKCNDNKQFSVDRIDSTKGHIEGNIQLLCWGCNRSKKNRF